MNTLQDAAGSAEVRTLRYALNQVNASGDANNTIHFDDCPNGIINLQTPLPPITHTASVQKIVEIRGRGRENLEVTRGVMQAFRIFEVSAVAPPQGSTLSVIISRMTVSNGLVEGTNVGGGILNRANSLTLDDVKIKGNRAVRGGGVALENGSLVIRNSLVTGNTAQNPAGTVGFGGGIVTAASTILTIQATDIGDNLARTSPCSVLRSVSPYAVRVGFELVTTGPPLARRRAAWVGGGWRCREP